MKTIYFITGNKGKLEEAKQKFLTVGINVIQKDLGYPEIQAEALEDVAKFGVEHVQKKFDQPFILEDAGLFIDKLDGFPGVYSSYVSYTVGLKGILKLLEGMNETKRGALFRSVFAYSETDEKPRLFVGECQGRLAFEEKGTNGFGYDPIFIPDGDKRTFAQMETEEKNSYSHRGKSLDKLIDFFKNNK